MNWRIQAGLVGWLYEEQKDQSGTNKGRAFACMGKRTRPLEENNVLDMEPCFGGPVTPEDSVELGGLVKWPHCFCAIVLATQPEQLVVIIQFLLKTEDSPYSLTS